MLAPSYYYNGNNEARRHAFVQRQRPSAQIVDDICRSDDGWKYGHQFSATQRSSLLEQRTSSSGNVLYETKSVERQYGTTYNSTRDVGYPDEISAERKWQINSFSSKKMAFDDASSFRSFSPTSMTSDGINLTSPTDEWQFGDVTGCSEAIARRNERERNRVRTINQTFSRLRQHLPASITWAAAAAASAAAESAANDRASTTQQQKKLAGARRPSSVLSSAVPGVKSKKLSKVQILRAAIDYIALLRQTLDAAAPNVGGDGSVDSSRYNRRRVTDAELPEIAMKATLSDYESERESCSGGDDEDDEESPMTSAIESQTRAESWKISTASDSEYKRHADESLHFRPASFRSPNVDLLPSTARTAYPCSYSTHVKVETNDDIYATYSDLC